MKNDAVLFSDNSKATLLTETFHVIDMHLGWNDDSPMQMHQAINSTNV